MQRFHKILYVNEPAGEKKALLRAIRFSMMTTSGAVYERFAAKSTPPAHYGRPNVWLTHVLLSSWHEHRIFPGEGAGGCTASLLVE